MDEKASSRLHVHWIVWVVGALLVFGAAFGDPTSDESYSDSDTPYSEDLYTDDEDVDTDDDSYADEDEAAEEEPDYGGNEAGMISSCDDYLDAEDVDYTESYASGGHNYYTVHLVDNDANDAGTCSVRVTKDTYVVS